MENKPWKRGPKELLIHGLEHLSLDTDFDNRMAIIAIDNSVELMLKTYLGLPKRVTGIGNFNRKSYEEAIKNFPSLIKAMETYALDKLAGVELGDIEWFHRIRNKLYHEGNGITIEKENVIAYSSIAKILFANLFDEKIDMPQTYSIDDFLMAWADFQKLLIAQGPRIYALKNFKDLFQLSDVEEENLNKIVQLRNKIIHSPEDILNTELNLRVAQLIDLTRILGNRDIG